MTAGAVFLSACAKFGKGFLTSEFSSNFVLI